MIAVVRGLIEKGFAYEVKRVKTEVLFLGG